MKFLVKALLLIIYGLIFFSCGIDKAPDETNYSNTLKSPRNGDLDTTFSADETQGSTDLFEIKKNELLADGWTETEIKNGQLPICYNLKPRKGTYDNYLEVEVGGGTDVAIKLMNQETEKCVRYVFINSKSTYRIKKIPEGIYYLKIAYGKNWLSKVQSGKCIGKFIRNPLYEKGVDILDFNIQPTLNGYSIPSYSLHLDVISTTATNSFNSATISEDYFNE